MLVPSSEKTTVPVGLASAVEPGALTFTVAVKVAVWPATRGLNEPLLIWGQRLFLLAGHASRIERRPRPLTGCASRR